MIDVQRCVVGLWRENSYFVTSNKCAWLIDPGQEFELLRRHFKADNYQIKGILGTHGHFDHIGAVADLKEMYNISFYMHGLDKRILHQANLYRKLAGDALITRTPSIDCDLADLKPIRFGNYDIKVYHTPGHSAGSVCFEIDRFLFSGDLFFSDGFGRTDLPGGNRKQIIDSIHFVCDRFLNYRIFPGHGESFVLTKDIASKIKQLK